MEGIDSKSAVNEMALTQLNLAADRIGLDPNVRGRLVRPDRALIVSVPTRMDNRSVHVFTAYRVQHNDALGPFKEASATILRLISERSLL